MVTSRKTKGRAVSMPLGIGYGLVTAITTTISLVAALVWLILANKVKEVHVGYFIMIIIFLSSFNGATISIVKIKRRMMFVSGIVGAVYFLTLLLTTAVAFGGRFGGMWVSGIMVVLGSATAGGLGISINTRSGHRYKKFKAG